LLWDNLIIYITKEQKNDVYLILREIHYEGIDNSYDVEDFTTDHQTALEKLQGYKLINKRKNTTYSILKYESPLLLTEEVA